MALNQKFKNKLDKEKSVTYFQICAKISFSFHMENNLIEKD